MLEIPVELGSRRYAIAIGHGLLRRVPELLAGFAGRRIALVASRRVFGLHGRPLQRALASLGSVHLQLLPDGERYKSRRTLARIHDGFVRAGLARDGLVLAFGGGVVGDVTGFAAATYMRGVDWVGIPSTLLSMVDSSVGGKVGINHPAAKNLIGAFHQPRNVVVDPSLLATLAPRELRSGAYEILKCAILGDRGLFLDLGRAPRGLLGWDRIALESAIATACRIKAEVVEQDEREGGLRRVLNLGHTIGHALEAVTGYRRFTHGEAVGWGLVGAAWIAHHRGLLGEREWTEIASAVDHLGPRPRVSDLDRVEILAALAHDKKARAGRVPFVLPTAIGAVAVRDDVQRGEITRALRVMAGRESLLA